MKRYRSRLYRAGSMLGSLLFVLPLVAALLTVAPATVLGADPQSGQSGQASTSAPTKVTVKRTDTPPTFSAAQLASLGEATVRSHKPVPTPPEGPGALNAKAAAAAPALASLDAQIAKQSTGKLSATDFSVFQNFQLPTGSNAKSNINEPSVAQSGNTIFVTYNWGAAVSLDGGNDWTFINPYTEFPATNGGFCCDQDVIYDPSRNIFIWELQYIENGSGNNNIRIAVATPQNLAANFWYYVDLTAQQVGFASGNCYDYPNVALDADNFFMNDNVFGGLCAGGYTGNVTSRLPLTTLGSIANGGGGGVSYFYYKDLGMSFVMTHGAKNTMYLVGHLSTTSTRVLTWPDSSTAVTATHDVTHNTFSTGSYSCPTPDGKNPCGRDDTRVKTAWVARGLIGLLWDVPIGVSGGFSFATVHVQGLLINESSFAGAGEPFIAFSNAATAYPGVAVNARGAVGTNMMFTSGTGGFYPSSIIWISDDINGYAYPGEYAVTRIGSAAATNPSWGDYMPARPSNGNGNSWVGVGWTLQGACSGGGFDCGGNLEQRLIRWGRQRDNVLAGKEALPAIFRSGGQWALRNSLSGGSATSVFTFGLSTDVPLMCDWTGNGQRYPVLFRGGQFIFGNSVTAPVGVGLVANFGASSDIPLCGDWTGQGKETIGLYRPSTAEFILSFSNNTPAANVDTGFGSSGDLPVVGDWDGNGSATIGIFRPSTAQWILSNSNTSPSFAAPFAFGTPSDKPIVGDWDRDGRAGIGIYRDGLWVYRNTLSSGSVDGSFTYGTTGDIGLVWR